MENKIEEGSKVMLKTGGPFMVVERMSEDGLVAYCSWRRINNTNYNEVVFLKSFLKHEDVGEA